MKVYRDEGYKSLVVWQKSYKLALNIYGATKHFPREELYGLTSQLRRAVSSMPINIAEGYSRSSRKEYLQFMFIAKGSCAEVETLLLMARDLGYIESEEFVLLDSQRVEVARLIQGMINALRR